MSVTTFVYTYNKQLIPFFDNFEDKIICIYIYMYVCMYVRKLCMYVCEHTFKLSQIIALTVTQEYRL